MTGQNAKAGDPEPRLHFCQNRFYICFYLTFFHFSSQLIVFFQYMNEIY